jgi:EAL domain-containing protein (putative c-di-GMP-specific phosphodiesterase class I)
MTETSAISPAGTAEAAPAETASPPLAPGDAPLCFVIDEEPSIRHFLSLVLHGSGVDAVEFPDGATMRTATARRAPDLIFHNVSLESSDAIESMIALGKNRYKGAVQLMSNRGAAVLEHVKGIGAGHKLNMLPVLKKPFETEAIISILRGLKLGLPPTVASRIDLEEALHNGWVEFWYQPKIDMRRRQLAGAEAYARARHPEHGIVPPSAFLPGANEASLLRLAELALICALKAGLAFAKVGINPRLTVNMPLAALAALPLEDIVRAQRPNAGKWAGLVIDVPEQEVIADFALAGEIAKKAQACNVQLAVDQCGRGYAVLAGREALPFAELKLDREFVADCASDRVNAPLCKQIIDLAHHFGRAAVGMGIEKAADASALVSMGCDFGEGYLFGQPMPEERFVSLLRQRAGAQGRKPAAAR